MAGLWPVAGAIDSSFVRLVHSIRQPPLSYRLPNRLFRNADGERFEDLTFSARVGHLQNGHGVAFGDVDGDGSPDLPANLGRALASDRFGPALFHDPLPDLNIVAVERHGTRGSAAATGARLDATLPDGRRIERLEIRWTAGLGQEVTGLVSGELYRIVEGMEPG